MPETRRDCTPAWSPYARKAGLLAALLLLAPPRPSLAQTTAPSVPAGGGAPAGNGPAPGVASGVPAPLPNRPLTLADVVSLAVGGNSGLVAARQRLQKAQELITQVNAQGRPQWRVDGTDLYSSYNAFPPTLPSPAIASPGLPGGGQIPVVVDQGNGFSTAFIGGGGGGNAPTTGGIAPSVGSSGSGLTPFGGGATSGVGASPIPGGSTPGGGGPGVAPPGGVVPVPAAPGPIAPAPAPAAPGAGSAPGSLPGGATPGNGGTAVPGGAPTTGAGSASAYGPGLSETTAFIMPDLPPIMQGYATPSPIRVASRVKSAPKEAPEDTTTPTGGTGTTSPVTGAGAARALGQRNNYVGRVSLSQYVDLFGLLSSARGAQQDVRDFYALDVERIGNETALAAKNLFFNALLGQAQVDTQAEQVRYAQENVRITEARLRQGIVSQFDVLTAQTALSTAQQQLISAQDQNDLAQTDLSYLLGTDPDRPLQLQTPPLPLPDGTLDVKQDIQVAQTVRPEVRQAQANVREARRLVKLAGSTLLPTLGLVASAEEANAATQTTPRSYATVGAQVAVPLDDGGATRSRVRSAQIDVQTQALTLEQVKSSVALEVRQATLNVRNAQAQEGAAETGVDQGQEAVRLAYLRYQGGLGTFLDVLNALAQLARTRTNLANADFFYQTSLAQLVRAMGGR